MHIFKTNLKIKIGLEFKLPLLYFLEERLKVRYIHHQEQFYQSRSNEKANQNKNEFISEKHVKTRKFNLRMDHNVTSSKGESQTSNI